MNIRFEKNRYTTFIAMEFCIKNQDYIDNPPYFYRDIFTEMKLIDPTTKLIFIKRTIYNNPKYCCRREDCINEFKATKKGNM